MNIEILRSVGGPLAVLALAAQPARAQAGLYTIQGTHGAMQVGRVVARLGDMNHDGVEDFALGNPLARVGGVTCGVVAVYSGRDGSFLASYKTLNEGERLGQAVSSAGDFDNDGWLDVLVGAPGYDDDRGKAHVFSGKTGAILWTRLGAHAGAFYGSAVALVGRADGNPGADFAVSAPFEDYLGQVSYARVRIYSGGSGAEIAGASATMQNGQHSGFGWALSGGFDWNGDGWDDLLVGAPFYTWPSQILNGLGAVVSGSNGALLKVWIGDSGDQLGTAVAVLGDLDGDGRGDVALGAPLADAGATNNGEVRVCGSATGGLTLFTTFSTAGSRHGSSVGACDDIDGDGRGDFVVGTPQYTTVVGGMLGRVTVHSGQTGALVTAIVGTQADGHFGYSVAGLGDLNHDGRGDFIAGEPFADTLSSDVGKVRVFLGNAPLPSVYGAAKTNSLGCVPKILAEGAASLSVGNNFHVRAGDVISKRPGMLIWSLSQAQMPFGGGTLHVGAPIRRTGVQDSGGSWIGTDCTGTYDFHFDHAYMAANGITPGTTVFSQYWMRDPGFAAPNNIGLTSGLRFQPVP